MKTIRQRHGAYRRNSARLLLTFPDCGRHLANLTRAPEMLVNRKFDAFVVFLVVVLIGYVLLQPGYRLKEDPPLEFLRDAHVVSVPKRAAEEKIARAYWKCAVTNIQWQYGYGHRLPASPPAEFTVSSQEFGLAASDLEARNRYWKKLQQVWYVPGVWRKEYDGSLRPMRNWLQAAGDWLADHTVRITSHP